MVSNSTSLRSDIGTDMVWVQVRIYPRVIVSVLTAKGGDTGYSSVGKPKGVYECGSGCLHLQYKHVYETCRSH